MHPTSMNPIQDPPRSTTAAITSPVAPALHTRGRAVPEFTPVRPRGGRHRLRRALRRRRRPVALAFAAVSAALALAVPWSPEEPAERQEAAASGAREGPARGAAEQEPAESVAAPVRIADAAAVRLLSPGDRVDVLAASADAAGEEGGGAARVVARRARVAEVPDGGGAAPVDGGAGGGALVVLTVSPETAARLAGAAAESELVVTRW
ncbi:RcpC/CpaB family pilus assembly protein [Streptomyces sp. NPDC127098]|uniref:RcpC/CpaB family pilus assembly protein n=1 Tax=Streptomyces sp. NPDC127098 TaxID=3347137 RepID=UPI0036604A2E